MKDFGHGIIVGLVLAASVALVVACERKGTQQDALEGKAAYHVKCWSGGSDIFEEDASRVVYGSWGMTTMTSRGEVILKADCVVTTK